MAEAYGLYVHIPWCVRKCPYCDFNSHALKQPLPEIEYVQALLTDLLLQLEQLPHPVEFGSIFLGGGTPSLLSGDAIERLLAGIRQQAVLREDCEITLEANPGTAEQQRFRHYLQAGVNRLSLGLQSFNNSHLKVLGRIHDGKEAQTTLDAAFAAGFERVNGDLMFGLPHQNESQALQDIHTLLQWPVEHVSLYQLTLEPNTLFAHQPPPLPEHDQLATLHENLLQTLHQAGFSRYEVSALARPDAHSRHNLNYWRYGHYLGIGAGAHGKWRDAQGKTMRSLRPRHPQAYMEHIETCAPLPMQAVAEEQLPFEFMLNALRLTQGVETARFEQATGLSTNAIQPQLDQLRAQGLLHPERLACSPEGYRFLDDVVATFLP